MSFLDDIIDVGKSAIGGIKGLLGGSNNILGGLISTALTGFALYKVNQSVSATNNTAATASPPAIDPGNKIAIKPNTQQKIPVIYGTAYVPGIITDAVASNGNQTMTYVITICEKTGVLLSDGTNSQFSFENVYIDGNRMIFQGDGITVNYVVSPDGQVDNNPLGLIKVYCYAGGSSSFGTITGYAANTVLAYNVVPGWDNTYTMNDLIFAVVQVTYNKDKGVTGLPNMSFSVKNSMTLPGDCLNDYMINERYGAGIGSEEIYSE